jgi:hypothetical protein
MDEEILDTLILPVETIRKTKPTKFYISIDDLVGKNRTSIVCPYCSFMLEDIALEYEGQNIMRCTDCNTIFIFISQNPSYDIYYMEKVCIKC